MTVNYFAAMTDAELIAQAEAWMNSDLPVSDFLGNETDDAIDVAPVALSGRDLAIQHRQRIGRKLTGADIANGGALGSALYDAAAEWLPSQTGASFDWLADLAKKYVKGGGLSDGQAAGVLNCLYADHLRNSGGWGNATGNAVAQRAATYNATAAADMPDLDAEIAAATAYRDHLSSQVTKGFYTVAKNAGHTTIKVGKWVDDRYRGDDHRVRWIGYLTGSSNTTDYTTVARQTDDGAITMLRAYAGRGDLRAVIDLVLHGTMSERDDMRGAYALESGNCAICNRVLTDVDSIKQGIGPICAQRGVF